MVVIDRRSDEVLLERRRPSRRRKRANRHLRDPLSARQRRQLIALMSAWGVATIVAWTWWLQPAHDAATPQMVLNSLLLAVESVALPLWFYVWLWRMKRPDPALAPPELRVAMIVTKAPAEPWQLVRRTLWAMLHQDVALPYDVWLADEHPEPHTLRWCEEHSVRVSSREGIPEYNRPNWPRRRRCKEGNLAYFYDMWGYEMYDVVVQLDADHVPEPPYLGQMLVPFRDPHVGYVAAPSICDSNASRSWSARGRLYSEAVLHGPVQAGNSGGCAPSCFGSHYAVRTAALHEIGGLGPELAEDFTTTLMLSSAGWHGVFAVDAEAHGAGPETVADCLIQEVQWSRSMMNVLLSVNRHYWSGLSRMAKLRLGFCELWYPAFGLLMAANVLLPLIAIVTRVPLVSVSLPGFGLHFGAPMLVLLATCFWLRSGGWLRPRDANPISWEAALFQVIRWPWVLYGCGQAVVGRIRGREFEFKVTPKGSTETAPLPVRIVLPYLLLALVSAAPALLQLNAGRAHGYVTLALINAGVYLLAAIAIIGLHVLDHPASLRLAVLGDSLSKIGATGGTAAMLVLGIAFPGLPFAPHAAAPPTPDPWPAVSGPTPPVAIGATTDALARNAATPWRSSDLGQVNRFEQSARTHLGIVMWFADWRHNRPDLAQLRAVAARGSIPEISWEPWNASLGLRHPQPRYTLGSIIAGRHDDYIRAWARTLRDFGSPVLLRFAQEMNGNWYPWSEGVNGNRPGQFVAAWRHVHDIFAATGATNVKWVWSPVARFGRALGIAQYPGDAYVDVFGLSGFNGGSALPWSGWRSFSNLFSGALDTLHQLSPVKPIQISEVSTVAAGGDDRAWVRDMFAVVAAHPQISSLVWFDVAKQADWRLTRSAGLGAAFASGIKTVDPPVVTGSDGIRGVFPVTGRAAEPATFTPPSSVGTCTVCPVSRTVPAGSPLATGGTDAPRAGGGTASQRLTATPGYAR